LRGIFSAGRMFSINDDRSILTASNSQESAWLFNTLWLEILLWICHVMALIVVQAALISLFARKLNDRLRLWFGSHREIFIIIGNSRSSYMLGENIATRDNPHKRPCKDRLIVFVLEEDSNTDIVLKKIVHLGGILLVLDKNNNILDCIKKTGLGRWNAFSRKYKIILFSNNTIMSEDVGYMVEYAKSKNVKQQNMEIFALTLSEWDREKIEAISKVTEKIPSGSETNKYQYIIHILTEVDLITRKMLTAYSPYNCLKSKNALIDGKSNKDFTVMILGFGTIGQHAFLRLMMNGQFVGSCMRAIIADFNLENARLYDRFQHNYPAVDLCCEINKEDRLNIDVLSIEFYKRLEQIGGAVDYIVISLGNDEDNKKVALDLQRHYLRCSDNVPIIAVSLFEKNNFQTNKIFSFGCLDDIYKESEIINEKTDFWAKKLSSGYNRGQFKRDIDDKIEWHELNWFSQESKRAQVDFLPSMLELSCFNNEQSEILKDVGKVLYRMDEKKREYMKAKNNKNESMMEKIQKKLDEDKTIKENLINKLNLHDTFKETLAHTEHLRWNAFHVAMGYSPISLNEMMQRYNRYEGKEKKERLNLCRKDESLRLHFCLVHWNELDKYYVEYLKINPTYKDFKEMDYDGVFNNIAKYLYVKSELSLT